MTTVDTTIVATALETLQKELNTTINWVGWSITAFSFGFVMMLPLSAKFSQWFGSRRLFLVSIGLFTFASLLCGLVSTIGWLIPFRVIQAMGAAGITPSVTAIIVEHFGSARDRAVGLFGSIFPIGVMLGPSLGGLIVTYWHWRWIFFVNIPIGIAVIIMAIIYIPKDDVKQLKKREKMDFPGLLFLGMGILSGMYAATYLGQEESQFLSWEFLVPLALSVAGITSFFRHIERIKEPFILPRFVHGKYFGAVNLLNLLYAGVTTGVLALVPLYAANRFGISALNAAILLIAQGAASVIFSTVMAMLLRRTGYRLPLYVGASVITIGIALLSFYPLYYISPYYWMMGATILMGSGMGIISPAARNAGLQLAPKESATLAALRSLCLQLGSIVSVGIATAIIAGKSNPGLVHAHVYLGIALLYVVGLVVIRGVPEHKGAW